jgi:uncharacterized protein (DUF1778 family)
LNNWVW